MRKARPSPTAIEDNVQSTAARNTNERHTFCCTLQNVTGARFPPDRVFGILQRAMSRVGTSPNKHKSQQIREAFPWDQAPRYLIRDRDAIFGKEVIAVAKGMGIKEVVTAQSPWQNPYVERLIGSIRRECLDHVIVVNERGLSRVLTRYLTYYHQSRTHLALAKDAPRSRPIGPAVGPIIATPQVGGLHHRYDRRAA